MPAALSLNAPKDSMHAARANARRLPECRARASARHIRARSPHDRNRSTASAEAHAMNYTRIALATLASTVVYFILGGILFAASPLKREFERFPDVYRSPESMKGVWPAGIAGMVLSMLALSILFAMLPQEGLGTRTRPAFWPARRRVCTRLVRAAQLRQSQHRSAADARAGGSVFLAVDRRWRRDCMGLQAGLSAAITWLSATSRLP